MRIHRRLNVVVGAALALLAALISTSGLLGAIGRGGIPLGDPLRQGAVLFKLGLIVLGLYIVVLEAVPLDLRPRMRDERTGVAEARWTVWGVLVAILVTCALLCFHRLDDGLWFDEIVTYVRYARLPFGHIVSTYDEENQHVLYSLLAHASFLAMGESAWALRLPAVLLGIGSVWALFMVGRLVGSVREALLSSALLAFSYPLIWFSQDARGYTGLLFLTLLSSWFFIRGLREARPHLWALYAVTVALGLYIHITMLFVVAGHFVEYVVACVTQRRTAWPQRWTVLLYGFGLSALLVFQLYALVLPQVFTTFARPKLAGDSWTQPWMAALEFARGLRLSFSGSSVALAALVVFGAGLLSFARADCAVPQLLVLPMLICAAVKLGTRSHLWPRSVFFAIGFMVLVTIRGTAVLGQALARPLGLRPHGALTLGTILSLALILAAARSIPSAYGPKQDFAGALAFTKARKAPGDALVSVGLAAYPYQTLYRADAEEVKTVADLDAVRARAPRTWLLYTLGFQVASVEPELMRSIERDFVVERIFPGTLGGGAVFVCRANRPTPGS